jgi:nucleotide-binding universal stress UspA family protein
MSMQPLGPVVVGVDGSDPALAALDLAAEEAAARVTPLTVVHAYAPDATADAAARDRHARRILATAVDRARVEHPALAVTATVIAAEPADALVRSAMESPLLVLGHRSRRSGVRPPASVTARVLSEARAPVLIHRPFDTPVSAGTRPVVVGPRTSCWSSPLRRRRCVEPHWSLCTCGHRPTGISPAVRMRGPKAWPRPSTSGPTSARRCRCGATCGAASTSRWRSPRCHTRPNWSWSAHHAGRDGPPDR